MDTIKRLLSRFNMKTHPEGGYYGVGFRSSEFLRKEQLPNRYDSPRNLYSSIYFMVTKESPSRFHKLKTDELWHFYSGDNLVLHMIQESGKHEFIELSNQIGHERFQYLVHKNTWMAATCKGELGYSLLGCTLTPGFEFEDFETGNREQLTNTYPHLEFLIKEFT